MHNELQQEPKKAPNPMIRNNPKVPASRYKVVIIEEGLGNLGSAFYYTKECIESAPALFEGKKAYANHPDAMEEKIRPERSVKDIIGHYESCRVEEGDQGQAMLVADLIVLPGQSYDWARAMLETSVNYSGKFNVDFIGISINATGPAESVELEKFMKEATIPPSTLPKMQKALAEGIREIQVCSQLKEAVSADMVTEAGARGRVLQMLEQEKKRMSEKKEKKQVAEDEAKSGIVTDHSDDDGKKDAPVAKEEGADDAADKKKAPPKSEPSADDDKDGDKEEEAEESEEGEEHDDEDEDKKLIAQMLKKYLGDGDHGEEAHQAMSQAHKMAKEMGLEGEEAEKAAGYSVKMAKHEAEKKAKAAEESEVDAGDQPGKSVAAVPQISKPGGAKGPSEKKESEILTLRAENVALKEKIRKTELKDLLDKKLRESKLPREYTDEIRTLMGEKFTSESLDKTIKSFKKVRESVRGESDGLYDAFVISTEKTESHVVSENGFADCVDKQ